MSKRKIVHVQFKTCIFGSMLKDSFERKYKKLIYYQCAFFKNMTEFFTDVV